MVCLARHAHAVAAQADDRRRALDDTTERLFGLTVAGIQRFFEGRFQPAVDYIERAVANGFHCASAFSQAPRP